MKNVIAPTAISPKTDDALITYLNRGQLYAIDLKDSQAESEGNSTMVTSTISITFHEKSHRQVANNYWKFWLSQQRSSDARAISIGKIFIVQSFLKNFIDEYYNYYKKKGRIEERQREKNKCDYKIKKKGWGEGEGIVVGCLNFNFIINHPLIIYILFRSSIDDAHCNGVVNVRFSAFDRITFDWDTRQGARIHVRFHCLSTDFSRIKGVKGIPLRIHIQHHIPSSSSSSPSTNYPGAGIDPSSTWEYVEESFCKIKLFRDKGAERKNKDNSKQYMKHCQKMQGKISFNCF